MTVKRLSEEQFSRIVQLPNLMQMSEQTRHIAYRCLVKGEQQSALAKELNLTRGAISQTVNRVWNACPPGYVLVTALITEEQAFQVKQWENAALKAIKGTK
ncbi:TrfB-related DNA-binding protein [Metapseudomonas furukawaii]|uniref:TrfB-related DNA-binding protein n=1 Tax=Metapseudomonas furukawaii TaxID=1149133 RepID=UPI00056C8F64|nr:TrfB-related DNA-binding protein [Pseudomonas furukawaii]